MPSLVPIGQYPRVSAVIAHTVSSVYTTPHLSSPPTMLSEMPQAAAAVQPGVLSSVIYECD